jgi:hypothetical protein
VADYHTPQELIDVLESVTDWGLVPHHHEPSGETLVECKVCGEWEGHTDLCPVPAIQKWQNHG